jgi:DNA-binding NarL/FixJ family response regulator
MKVWEASMEHPNGTTSAENALTARELQVLRLVTDGLSDREIGSELRISHRTAMSHVASIRRKLQVTTRTAAASHALRDQLI